MKMIVAADKNWGIGKNNKLLVSIPADMRRFRQETTGKVVVMGRRTLESFPGGTVLKDRVNIVLTQNPAYEKKNAVIVHSLNELFDILQQYDPEDVYCIGGESIYSLLLPWCDLALVTRIDYSYEADSHFPDLDADPSWQITEKSEEQTYFDLAYRFLTYSRISSS